MISRELYPIKIYIFTVDKNVSRAFFLYPELLVYKLKVIPFVWCLILRKYLKMSVIDQ